MRIGTSHVDITPAPGVELSGFAVRTQPSIGVLDPLYAKALFLEADGQRLLWVHCDLIGFEAALVSAFRRTVKEKLGLGGTRVMLSATHTHSGPGTVRLHECGEFNPAYVARLHEHLLHVAQSACSRTENCSLVAVDAPLVLAIDRRGKADAHTDPRVAGLGFLRDDGTWAAVLVNHAMHPVALGSSNRQISADIPGQVAPALSAQLPGSPLVLVTNGACGNLNPPDVNVPYSQVKNWGSEIATALAGPLRLAAPAVSQRLAVQTRSVALPLDTMGAKEIEAYVQRSLATPSFQASWGDRFRRAVAQWQHALSDAEAARRGEATRSVELMCVALGSVVFVGVNAEVFSRFAADVRRAAGCATYVVGYANGVLGYLPTMASYAEGGYEVDAAHFFYGGFRFKPGALEQLTQEAVALVRDVSAGRTEAILA